MITMLAGGLWHGAAWTFVVWGGIHGAALVINHEFRRIMKKASRPIQIPKLASWFLTINFVCIAWIFFRSPDFSTSLIILKKYLLLDLGGERSLPMWLAAFAPILLLLQWAIRRFNVVSRAAELPLPAFSLGYGACWAVVMALLPLSYRPFIYFQF
jgi:alginate O-acetyltransferase complex protein AlgI